MVCALRVRRAQRLVLTLSRFAALFAAIALLPSTAEGERLPIRAYTTVDGLAHNTVNKMACRC